MTVEVMQYKMPDGRQVPTSTNLPDEYRDKYIVMLSKGWRFAAEVLSDGQVSLTIENPREEVDENIRIVENGPNVQVAMIEMLNESVKP